MRALTYGQNVFLGSSEYPPISAQGRETLAHELVHTAQGEQPEKQKNFSESGDSSEMEASSIARTLRDDDDIAGKPSAKRDAHLHFQATATFDSEGDAIQVMETMDFLELLQLPQDSAPYGAEDNPDFLMSLAADLPGSKLSRLEEMVGVPESVIAALPHGHVAHLPTDQLLGLEPIDRKEPPPGLGAAHGVIPGATHGAMHSLVHHGYNAAGPNAIGIVAFPQSRLVRRTIQGNWGQGPWLPESRIVLGHTAIYIRVDGEIKLLRSFASASLVEAALNMKGVSGGTSGVQAAIIDHLGDPFPPGGGMFDIASGRSIEYAIPQETALDAISRLPEGGALPGELYTARPEVASQLGQNTRLCFGRNCVHWAVSEVESVIGNTVGSGGSSVVDQPAEDAARQGKLVQFLKESSPGEEIRLPSGEAASPVRGEMPATMKVLKWGDRVFNVYAVYHAAHRISEAPGSAVPEILGEELGAFGGAHLGAGAGVSGCVALGITTGGVGLLICGLAGGAGGSWLGERIGGFLGAGIGAVIFSPLYLARGLQAMVEIGANLTEIFANLAAAPLQFIASSLIAGRERLNWTNWDLRGMPLPLAAAVQNVGEAIWREIEPLDPMAFLARSVEPLVSFTLPSDSVERVAIAISAETDPSSSKSTLDSSHIFALNPHEFVEHLESLRLRFIQNPEYIAGFGGSWDDESILRIHFYPLIRRRAELNPYNWDLSGVPSVEFDDGRPSIDVGEAVLDLGLAIWSDLRNVPAEELLTELEKPLSTYGLPPELSIEVETGVNEILRAQPRMFGTLAIEPGSLANMTPATFVQTLLDYKLGLRFRRAPSEVAELAMEWMQSGFQPW